MAEPKKSQLETLAETYAITESARNDYQNRANSYRRSATDADNEALKLDAKLAKLRRQIAEETGLLAKVRGSNHRGEPTIEPLTSSELAAIDKQIQDASPDPQPEINHSGRE